MTSEELKILREILHTLKQVEVNTRPVQLGMEETADMYLQAQEEEETYQRCYLGCDRLRLNHIERCTMRDECITVQRMRNI